MPPRDIPGFYWDNDRNRYFLITQDHRPPAKSKAAATGEKRAPPCPSIRKKSRLSMLTAHGASQNIAKAISTRCSVPERSFRTAVAAALASSRPKTMAEKALDPVQHPRCIAYSDSTRMLCWSDANRLGNHTFSSFITSVAPCGDSTALVVSTLGGEGMYGAANVVAAAGIVQSVSVKRKSCWTAAPDPLSSSVVAMGCSKSLSIADMTVGRTFNTINLRSDPLVLSWAYPQCLWVGQRDGYVHLMDLRVRSRSRIQPAAASSPPFDNKILSPVSAISTLHGDGTYILQRSGAIRALVPGYGSTQVTSGQSSGSSEENLLLPLGMTATDGHVVSAQPLGLPWLAIRSQSILQTIPIKTQNCQKTCSELVYIPDAANMKHHPFASEFSMRLDQSEEGSRPYHPVVDSVVGCHSKGLVAFF